MASQANAIVSGDLNRPVVITVSTTCKFFHSENLNELSYLLNSGLESRLLKEFDSEFLVVDVGESQRHCAHDLRLEEGVVDETVACHAERHAVDLKLSDFVSRMTRSTARFDMSACRGAIRRGESAFQRHQVRPSPAASWPFQSRCRRRTNSRLSCTGPGAGSSSFRGCSVGPHFRSSPRSIHHRFRIENFPYLWNVLCGLEAVGGELALVHDPLQRCGDSFNRVHEERRRPLADFVGFEDGVLRVEIVHVDSHLEQLIHLLLQLLHGVLFGCGFSFLE